MPESAEKITRALTIRYVAVLAILGGLAIASFLGISRIGMDAESGTALVSVAGRQRMLVERAAFAASQLALLPPKASERAELERIFIDSLDLLESAHAGLLAGLPELKAPKPPSEAVAALYFGPAGEVDSQLRAFAAHGRALAARFPDRPRADDADFRALSAAALGPLLDGLERIAVQYRAENERRMTELSALHGGALAAILFFLVVSAAGVFQPMAARIRADIERRALAEKGLRESEERLWKILEEAPGGVSVSRRQTGLVVFANPRFCEMIGATPDEVIGQPAGDHYMDAGQRAEVIRQLKADGHVEDAEVQFRRKGGGTFWSLLTIRSIRLRGETLNLAWIYDISRIKEAEGKLRLTAKVVESASEAVLITNSDNVVEFVNPAFTAITEYTPEEIIGRNPKVLRSGRHDEEFYREMWRGLRETGRWRGEIWNRRKSGAFYAEWLSIVALKDEAGKVTHHIAIFSDITHRKEDEERVWRQANYDALTGLPNRALFLDRLSQAVRQSRRDGKRFALLFLDLDGFKAVNDTLGHAAGDLLLQQVSLRLGECMRSSDTVARLAGDEFTCILQGVRGREDAAMVAAKILGRLSDPFDLMGNMAQIRGSIGIAVFPDNADDAGELLQAADSAMYRVKRKGKNNFVFVDEAETVE